MQDLLFSRDRSVLAVIDVQDVFLDKLPTDARAPLVGRVTWLIGAAVAMGVPVVAMAEDLARNGPPVAPVLAALPEGTTIHDKRVFGLAGQSGILAAMQATGRDQAILVGLETDVCIAQSALGLLGAGFRVGAVADATGAPGDCHQAGLDRMRDAAVAITTVKGVYYEWVRDLDTLDRIKPLIGSALPDGLTL
ncbi:MAG: isochorismatase family protein [Rhodobacteraceae bacterium]|nr:isochorismatase family protein [Paracoccaceae bacterium]